MICKTITEVDYWPGSVGEVKAFLITFDDGSLYYTRDKGMFTEGDEYIFVPRTNHQYTKEESAAIFQKLLERLSTDVKQQ